MTQRLVLESLKRQYLWIDAHFNELFTMITDSDGKHSLRAAYVGSRDNLCAARIGCFIEGDPTVRLLYEALIANQEKVEMLAATGDSERLIDLITQGVGLGSRLSRC